MLAQSEYRREEKSARLKGVAECYHKVVEEKQCVSLKTLAVTGRDLIQAGYKPGPELGEVLKEMLEQIKKNIKNLDSTSVCRNSCKEREY